MRIGDWTSDGCSSDLIRAEHVQKREVIVGARLIVLGGPAMLIGLGGGAASSMATGASSAELDFASVQRANPELERRCQEVVDACWALGAANPILSISSEERRVGQECFSTCRLRWSPQH